ncbi:hypothetical protein TRFO_36339 [Tritrichomonas foetus]|uniref:Uncharacterized protein n=1 Tax=Tritrichomonas foetus TaxID=1144522 RepID=A0A1J4JIU0_9EUKA|nr:hypothetical protein TRFO_36339 [Tritrichomonas foetus]|eukprot:OHS97475.1 hypothetical protein TRFO_36339 [Tritrichomonas foetus]
MLSLERICEVVQSPELRLKKAGGYIDCSTISRRRISSALSSSELFVRAGAPRTCLWAIRPNNPLLISDGQISASIEQMLTTNGPMSLEQFVQATDLSGCDAKLFERFLNDHSNEFTVSAEDGKYWFTGQKRPTVNYFDNICQALVYAFQHAFPRGACVEELHWFLCLSIVGGHKTISRRNVSRELSRRTDLFMHLSRARYTLLATQGTRRAHSLPNGVKVPTNFDDPSNFNTSIPTATHQNICPLFDNVQPDNLSNFPPLPPTSTSFPNMQNIPNYQAYEQESADHDNLAFNSLASFNSLNPNFDVCGENTEVNFSQSLNSQQFGVQPFNYPFVLSNQQTGMAGSVPSQLLRPVPLPPQNHELSIDQQQLPPQPQMIQQQYTMPQIFIPDREKDYDSDDEVFDPDRFFDDHFEFSF